MQKKETVGFICCERVKAAMGTRVKIELNLIFWQQTVHCVHCSSCTELHPRSALCAFASPNNTVQGTRLLVSGLHIFGYVAIQDDNYSVQSASDINYCERTRFFWGIIPYSVYIIQ